MRPNQVEKLSVERGTLRKTRRLYIIRGVPISEVKFCGGVYVYLLSRLALSAAVSTT